MTKKCQISPLRIRRLDAPKDDLVSAIYEAYAEPENIDAKLEDGDIIVISSKVLAIHQGRCRKISENIRASKGDSSRKKLIQSEADFYLEGSAEHSPAGSQRAEGLPFTVKESTPIPFAGIDESNANSWQVLWPENPSRSAAEIRGKLQSKYHLSRLAVLIIDSGLFPLRKGSIGLSIGASGLHLIEDHRGDLDLYGRELKMSSSNIADSLAGLAHCFMGQGAEQTPVVQLRGFSEFCLEKGADEDFSSIFIEAQQDFYWPLFRAAAYPSAEG